jgi:thymidylate synthase (FAD)
MRLIKPSYEIIEQGPGLQGIYDIIEKCGKTSYKSEPKGGETAKKFVEARAKEGHGAVLEFGTVYLTFSPGDPTTSLRGSGDDETKSYMESRGENIGYFEWSKIINFYRKNAYSKVTFGDHKWYVTTNYRVLVENDRLDDLKYLCEPTEYHEKRYCVKFITDIGVGREFLRHRTMSMVQESTRYVNYMKERFGEELTFVIPSWIDLPECENLSYWDGDWVDMKEMKIVCPEGKTKTCAWLWAMDFAEKQYRVLTATWEDADTEEDNKAWQAQQARTVLPLSTKTEFVMSGFRYDWVHFFCLRTDIAATGKPHPQAQELANPLRDEFIERGYITEEELNERIKLLKDAEKKRS